MSINSFSALLTSFSQVKIINCDLFHSDGVDRDRVSGTIVVDLKRGSSTWRLNVARLMTIKQDGRVLRYEVEVSDRALEKFGKLIGRRANKVKRFSVWASESPYYATAFSVDTNMFNPGPGNWTFKAKKSIKLDIHNMIADHLAYVDETLHADYRDQVATAAKTLAEEKAAEPAQSVGIVMDNPEEFEAMCAKYAAKNRAAMQAAQEPAQAVAEVEPTETTVEPMTAREHKMRGDLECLLAFVRCKLQEYDAEGCQVDDQGEPIDREKVKLGEFIAQAIEGIMNGAISDQGAGGFAMSQGELDHFETLRGDIEIDFSKFRAQVADFRRHHYNDGAWPVPAGSSIDAECARIESMEVLGQVKAYLDYHMGPGEFSFQICQYLRGDHRPSPEDMEPDEVLKYVLEFSAMQTGNGRGFDLLDTQEAADVLVEMNDDSDYLQRFTDRARVIMLARTLDVAVPAAR